MRAKPCMTIAQVGQPKALCARAQIYSVGGAIVLFVILVAWHCNEVLHRDTIIPRYQCSRYCRIINSNNFRRIPFKVFLILNTWECAALLFKFCDLKSWNACGKEPCKLDEWSFYAEESAAVPFVADCFGDPKQYALGGQMSCCGSRRSRLPSEYSSTHVTQCWREWEACHRKLSWFLRSCPKGLPHDCKFKYIYI